MEEEKVILLQEFNFRMYASDHYQKFKYRVTESVLKKYGLKVKKRIER